MRKTALTARMMVLALFLCFCAAGCGVGDYGGEDILVAALVMIYGELSLKLYVLSQIGVGGHHHV